jgi:hypothetical protein
MMKVFDATNLSISEDEGIFIVGISDSIENPVHFVIFQKELNLSPQDIELGLDGCFIESSEFDESGYNKIKFYEINDRKLTLYFDPKATDLGLLINLQLFDLDILNLKEGIAKCFSLK